jgi:hypothetical protein
MEQKGNRVSDPQTLATQVDHVIARLVRAWTRHLEENKS